jgi:hypothetical protein
MNQANNLEEQANQISINANPNCPLSKKQLQRLLDAINQLPRHISYAEICDFERLCCLDFTQVILNMNAKLAKEFFDVHNSIKYEFVFYLPCNPNVVFMRVNEFWDIIAGKKSGNIGDYTRSHNDSIFYKNLLTSGGRGLIMSELIISTFRPVSEMLDNAFKRGDCLYNMKQLTLALLIYKSEHGEFPKNNWIEKLKPYLGDDIEKYLHCPSCPNCEKDKTNYALVLYDKLPEDKDTLLLIELQNPVPFDQAVITSQELLNEFNTDITISKLAQSHAGVLNVAKQNGAVTHISNDFDYERNKKLLGINSEKNNQ